MVSPPDSTVGKAPAAPLRGTMNKKKTLAALTTLRVAGKLTPRVAGELTPAANRWLGLAVRHPAMTRGQRVVRSPLPTC